MASLPAMAPLSPPPQLWRLLLVLLGLLATFSRGQASLFQKYCSDENTGSNDTPNVSIYQTLGNCQGLCSANYAYAIVQGENCWCSNTTPSNQLPVSSCNDKCLGYPFEMCGSINEKLYGYLALSKQPDSSSPASKIMPSVTTPITTQQVKTVSGSVITAFVTIMPTSLSSGEQQKPTKQKMSSGSVIAIAVAVVIAAVVLLAALIIGFCCWRRKRSYYVEDGNSIVPQRNTSVLSKAGLLGGSSAGNSSDPYDKSGPMQERRNSKPLITDQRLNPNAFMQHDDGSATSVVSMQDNRDYTRTLNVRNPDPHPD